MARAWTKREVTYLKQQYPRRGGHFVARNLNRTYGSVQKKAHKLGLAAGIPPGFVPLVWVAPRTEGTSARWHAIGKAREDGVLEKPRSLYVVPEWWAEAYARMHGAELQATKRARDWITTKDIAYRLGVAPKTVVTNVYKRIGAGRYLRSVQRVRVAAPTPHYRWHPGEAMQAIRRYEADR